MPSLGEAREAAGGGKPLAEALGDGPGAASPGPLVFALLSSSSTTTNAANATDSGDGATDDDDATVVYVGVAKKAGEPSTSILTPR